MKVLVVLLVAFSVFAVLVGVGLLTQVTLGVGVMIGACWLVIVARLAQASYLAAAKEGDE